MLQSEDILSDTRTISTEACAAIPKIAIYFSPRVLKELTDFGELHVSISHDSALDLPEYLPKSMQAAAIS